MTSADPIEVEAELERILASSVFAGSARSVQFLRFCVQESLKGNGDQIKETTVAVQVFGRSYDYDPRTDPIVRVHARRLREKLDQYYDTSGIDNPIKITMPKGSYVPKAVRTECEAVSQSSTQSGHSDAHATSPPVTTDAAFHPVAMPAASRSLNRWHVLGIALGVVLALTIGLRSAATSSAPTLLIKDKALPLNSLPGAEQTPSWSPDGHAVAFSWNHGNAEFPGIYVQTIGDAQPRRVTSGSTAEFRPVWSPDGREIAFIRYVGSGQFSVFRVSLQGARETSVGIFSFSWLMGDAPPALDWSPDGRSLLVSEQPSTTAPIRLIAVDLKTAVRTPLTNPPQGTTGDVDAKYSPDGTKIAFRRGGLGDLYVMPSSGESTGRAIRLTPHNPGVRGITWTRDGSTILFGSREGGHGWGIWQIRADGSNLAPVLTGSYDLVFPSLSPDGTHLAAEQQDVVTNLAAVEPKSGKVEQLFAPSNRQDYAPSFSPDGMRVVYLSTRSGATELWIADASGSNSQELTHFEGDGFPVSPSWSTDGKTIFFGLRRDGATNIVSVAATGGDVHPLTHSSNRNINPIVSPDGHFLYFDSNDSGSTRIWRMPLNGPGSPEQMFWDVPWSFVFDKQNSGLLYQTSGTEFELARRDLTTGSLRTIFRSNAWLSEPTNLCAYRNTVYLMLSPAMAPFRQDLVAVNVQTGKATALQHFEHAQAQASCSVSPDGRRLLLATAQRFESDIYLASLTR